MLVELENKKPHSMAITALISGYESWRLLTLEIGKSMIAKY